MLLQSILDFFQALWLPLDEPVAMPTAVGAFEEIVANDAKEGASPTNATSGVIDLTKDDDDDDIANDTEEDASPTNSTSGVIDLTKDCDDDDDDEEEVASAGDTAPAVNVIDSTEDDDEEEEEDEEEVDPTEEPAPPSMEDLKILLGEMNVIHVGNKEAIRLMAGKIYKARMKAAAKEAEKAGEKLNKIKVGIAFWTEMELEIGEENKRYLSESLARQRKYEKEKEKRNPA